MNKITQIINLSDQHTQAFNEKGSAEAAFDEKTCTGIDRVLTATTRYQHVLTLISRLNRVGRELVLERGKLLTRLDVCITNFNKLTTAINEPDVSQAKLRGYQHKINTNNNLLAAVYKDIAQFETDCDNYASR
jgi:hypothetical protein